MRLSGGLELFENSGQMQQGVLVETKGGRFERECQNIFCLSVFFFPLLQSKFFFFKNRPNFLETLKQNTDKQTHLHRIEQKMGADWEPHFPTFVFTWAAQGTQGEGAAPVKRKETFLFSSPKSFSTARHRPCHSVSEPAPLPEQIGWSSWDNVLSKTPIARTPGCPYKQS